MFSYRYWKYRSIIFACITSAAVLIMCVSALVIFGGTTEEVPKVQSSVTVITPAPIPRPTIPIDETILARVAERDLREYKNKTRLHNLSEWYSWYREDVSGLKDMIVRTTIYGYRFEKIFQEHSTSWGTGAYFWHVPDPGMKYLFVYAAQFMDGDDPSMDPRMWGMEADHFTVQANGQIYKPLVNLVDPREPIRELENVWDIDHVHGIKPYGYDDLSYNRNNEQIRSESHWLRMGRSNKWDGWILYEVPETTRAEDVFVLGRFESLGGDAYWSLIP
jgi:hypothetical protein